MIRYNSHPNGTDPGGLGKRGKAVMPGISLDLVQTVALGPFNPHIVEPQWLHRQRLCTEDELRKVEFIPGDEPQKEAFLLGRREWQVDYTRLSIAVREPKPGLSDDPGAVVASVIGLLRHTPVRVVGHNFHFSCSLDEWKGYPVPQLGSVSLPVPGGFGLTRTQWTGSYHSEDVWLDVSVDAAQKEGVVVLLFNYDRPTNPEDHMTAVAAAGKLRDDMKTTVGILSDLFCVKWVP